MRAKGWVNHVMHLFYNSSNFLLLSSFPALLLKSFYPSTALILDISCCISTRR